MTKGNKPTANSVVRETSGGTAGSLHHDQSTLKIELRIQNEELQRTLAVLDATHRRYVQLFEHAPVGYLVVDEIGRIRAANRAASELLSVAAPALIDTNLASHVPTQVADALYRDRQRARSDRARCASELHLTTPDGRSLALHADTALVDPDEETYLTALTDVSELRNMERDLAHAERMEAVGRLASGVAHDFNNLLMGLSGCADMALAQLPEDASARMYLSEILRATSEGAAIASQLLSLARSDEAEPRPVLLDQAVTRGAGILRHLVGDNIRVRLHLGAPHMQVRMPPGRIEQVLLNLAANARDAMPAGGTLTISTRHVDPQGQPAVSQGGDCTLLQVSDTGTGMEPSVRARAVAAFFTTKPLGQGTGLGLSTVSRIVEQIGGLLQLDSAPGKGTSVRIYLPTEPATVDAPSAPTFSTDFAPNDATILVTEDDALVRMIVRYYLERAGFRVLEAGSGEEALQCMDNFPEAIDLLLTDLLLPGISGAELARAVAARRPELAVLLMSAHAAGDLDVGVGEVLAKPFTCPQLLEHVTNALGS